MLGTRDLVNGLIITFLTAIITGIIEKLNKDAVFTWMTIRPVLIAGISAALSYLLKIFASNSRNQLFTREHATLD